MINKDYLYSRVYQNAIDFIVKDRSLYLYAKSQIEERSQAIIEIEKQNNAQNVSFCELESIRKDEIVNKITGDICSLRSINEIKKTFDFENFENVYIDISGFNNRVTAALLRCTLSIENLSVHIVYIEPKSYEIKQFSAEGIYNDLSERIEGIEPLPGFANIIPDDVDMKFIALLGFEGGRFTQIIEAIQPPFDKVIPIIGSPGYRPEYPFVTYWGNRRALADTQSWQNVRYASANSIVDIFFLLNKIKTKSPMSKIKLAPIGTKPHVIGSILFAIKYPRDVEIIYDNPIRGRKRTDGIGLIVDCNVSELLKSI